MTNNNKLMIVCGPVDYGGAGKIIKFVVNHLVKQKWAITIYSLYQKDRPEALDERVSYIGRNGLNGKKYKFLHWRIDELIQIRCVVKKERPKILCAFVSNYVFVTRLATLGLKGLKFVGAERGDPYTLPTKWIKPVSWAYKHCDYCIFQLRKQGLFFGERVMSKSFVIPNPYIPLYDITPYTGERNNTIVSAGRFEYQKGYDVLIKAFAIVHAKHPTYKLILFGSGSLIEEYEKLANSLNLTPFIEYPGYVDNVADSVKKEGLFVLPSRFEGIPNALIEALSVGIPTISADCTPGGPDFLTDHGKRGMLVKVDDIEGTAQAINYLIENPSKATEYGSAGQEIVKELAPEEIAKQWENAFSCMM